MRALLLAATLAAAGACALGSCGGGSSSGTAESVTLLAPQVVLDHGGQIVQFPTTGRQPGQHTLAVRFRVVFEGFLGCEPDGHAGVMLRAKLDAIPSAQYRGHGLDFGRFHSSSFATRNLPDLLPIAVLETWSVGNEPPGFEPLLAASVSPALKDWTPYDVEIRSLEAPNRLGYSIANGAPLQNVDLADSNPGIDMSLESIAFFDAADGVNLCPNAIRITNLTAVWS
ncbi:MAG: hypothetical protein JWR07_1896 [Nevskia sp.]|nr:hypothetical protein [Nevskia sp.]